MILDRKYVKHLSGLLVIILFFKIAGFFTVSESVAITRVVKIFVRLMMTVWIIIIFNNLKPKVGVASFTHKNRSVIGFYLLYFILGFLSMMWSSDVVVSALQLIMDVELLLFSYLLFQFIAYVNHYSSDEKIRISHLLAVSIWLIMVVMIIGKTVMPDKFFRLTHGGDVARLGGFLMNPNELGMLSVIGASMCYFELKKVKNKVFVIIMLLFAVYALVLTQSRSSMIGFMIITGLFVNKSKSKLLKVGMYSGMVAVMPVIINTIFLKMGDLEEVLSMTGRLPFWEALLTEALPEQPIWGFGFMRIYYTDYFAGVHTYAAKMTHNTFVQVLMNLGLVGFGIVLAQMFVTIKAHVRSQDDDKRMVFLGVFIPIIINSFTEFGIFGETNFGILFYQFLIMMWVVEFNPYLSPSEKVQNSIIRNNFEKSHRIKRRIAERQARFNV